MCTQLALLETSLCLAPTWFSFYSVFKNLIFSGSKFLLVQPFSSFPKKKKKTNKRKSKAFSSCKTTFPQVELTDFSPFCLREWKQNILLKFPSIPQHLQLFSLKDSWLSQKKILINILIEIQTKASECKNVRLLSIIFIQKYVPISVYLTHNRYQWIDYLRKI